MRAPKRMRAGWAATLPATSASPWRKVVARFDQSGRHEREDVGHVAEIRYGVHPHQHEVVALRDHVLVHLLRARVTTIR